MKNIAAMLGDGQATAEVVFFDGNREFASDS